MPRLLLTGFLLAAALTAAGPQRIIFDTDMGNDIDDALALAMLHSLESQKESRLLAVTLTKDNVYAAKYIDAVDTFYGRGKIPIGLVRGGKTPEDTPMIKAPVDKMGGVGTTVYPRAFAPAGAYPDALDVLRKALRSAPDGSVVIAQVGFSTNLARLLDTDRKLLERKVRLLSVMGGAFPDGKPEYNIKTDIPSAQKLFRDWPGSIVFSGFEVGLGILYPAASIEKDFAYVSDHPVADSYRAYQKMPYDRPTWDLTSVLYGIRPREEYFSLSEPGTVTVDVEGKTHFAAGAGGRHRYLKRTAEQRKRVLAAFTELASRKPDRLR